MLTLLLASADLARAGHTVIVIYPAAEENKRQAAAVQDLPRSREQTDCSDWYYRLAIPRDYSDIYSVCRNWFN